MPVRRRPRVMVCEQQLLYGVVSVKEEEGGYRVRPLVGARVSVTTKGEQLVSATTRRDGSYSIMVGSCRKRDQDTQRFLLRVFKEEPCVRLNVTRAVQMDRDERMLWRHDIIVRGNDAVRLCEVTAESHERQDDLAHEGFYITTFEGDVTRHASAISAIAALLWGFFMLWAIARWASAGSHRQRRHYHAHNNQDQDSEPLMELGDYPLTLISTNKDSRRRSRVAMASVGQASHPVRPSLRTMKKPLDQRDLKARPAFTSRQRVVEVIEDDDTDDE